MAKLIAHMFNRNHNESKPMKSNNTKVPAPSNSLVSLVQGTVIEGTVEADGDIRVDGTIKGKLICRAKVIVGPSGHIEGEIHCKNAVVEGSVSGDLEVSELLNVRETARLNGKVLTDKLIVQSGALFNVECRMGQAEADVPPAESVSAVKQGDKASNHSQQDKRSIGKEKHATT